MPSWRPFTWIILVVNVLFLIWVIGGVAGSSGTPEGCGSLSNETCNEAEAVGTAIGVGLIIFFWALLDVILGVIWLVTRPKRRPCPACGTEVRPGITVCPSCGHDFRAGVSAPPAAPPPPPPRP